MIEIRLAGDAEKDWAAEQMAGSDPWKFLGIGIEPCRRACHHPEYRLFIAHDGETPCGLLLMHPRGVAGSPYISSIAVAEAYRGRGVGSRMLQFAEEQFQERARHIFLCVSSFNRRARVLYERRGYAAVGELPDYLIEGASEILMHKRLRRP